MKYEGSVGAGVGAGESVMIEPWIVEAGTGGGGR
jgi:hypothetical protein